MHIRINRTLKKLDVVIALSHDDNLSTNRIKSIKIEKKGFTLDELFNHWQKHRTLKKLYTNINHDKTLSNEQRKLLVGLLSNIKSKCSIDFKRKYFT